jgi:NAD+ synthase (glutamine-hydrolysing)
MRILLAQLNPIIGDFAVNTTKIVEALQHGRDQKADLVIFPELALSGYPPQDLLLHADFLQAAAQALEIIIPQTKDIAAVLGMPRQNSQQGEKPLYNSAAIIENGYLIGFQDKVLLPTYDVFDEKRYFEPGKTSNVWNVCGKKIAITICEDIWQHGETLRYTNYQHDPIKELALQQPELAINLSASPFSYRKKQGREKVCSKAALTLCCPLLLCNQVGGNDSLVFDGYSLYTTADGQPRQYAKGFEEDEFLVDLSASLPSLASATDSIADLYKALVLGIKDYFYKQGFTKACLGLSGGIDSALVACLAVEALGASNVLGVLMPSRYSSEGSIADALLLAKNLGISHRTISIEEPFKTYLSLLTPEWEGSPLDATEENLQARIRGMILMALSNKLGYIVLSTGNKSELAMGYSTLYGDLCGGLAVISDVTKGQVYALSKWINREQEVIPSNSISKPPSAELRPDQKDSDSLPPYEVIDAVVQDYVEGHLSAKQIADKHGYQLELVNNLVEKIHKNEYKRRQAPPGLRVSEKSFSIGRHFPIVQKF